MGLDEPDHHVRTAVEAAVALVEHGAGLADAGHGAEIDAKAPRRLDADHVGAWWERRLRVVVRRGSHRQGELCCGVGGWCLVACGVLGPWAGHR